ncbi:MAG: HAD hydrolase-like protein [Paracoccaceae bacterium]|nr:HAD hydrolase-like protein [Paracoccaceae bacterium]
MTAVFLDLDGTLMHSQPGILSSLQAALHRIGRPDIAQQDLTWMIGPPFIDSFTTIGLPNPQEAIDAYREIYAEGGMFDAEVYDGVFPMVEALSEAGHRLYLATAKPHVAATQITAHFGLAPFFKAEFGPELDGTRNWKGDLLAYALAETGEAATNAVMIGDRHHDFAAAESVGMPSVAVRWGYGAPEEWQAATIQIDHPMDLPGIISELGL